MTARVGRRMTSRVRARGWLRTESPLHVGGLGHDPSEPLPIAVDGQGRLYVPGTSLAGVLRAWSLGRDTETRDLDHLWGFIPRDEEPGDGHASRVIVADGLITADPRPESPPPPLEDRPSVGIDRFTGTAATEFLYSRAVVPAGCHIRLEIDIESDGDASADEARMGAFLTALADGDVRLGAATSRGLGAVRLLDHPSKSSWTASTPPRDCWPSCATTPRASAPSPRCGPGPPACPSGGTCSTSASPGRHGPRSWSAPALGAWSWTRCR
ncbi:RAMP superfamily CRISPR-associated protein [Thermocatellispora tengchongensis]|uniref:RAMP superfamily CRISPR-associated protein n=1 Tax=Thermocatellispora tengchongensis TaxID=1073253 RepID=UPI0036326F7D